MQARFFAPPLLCVAALLAVDRGLAEESDSLAACAHIAEAGVRLACYDRLAGRAPPTVPPVPPGRTVEVVPRPAPPDPRLPGPPEPRASFLSKYWELDPGDKRGTFNFTGYRPNFLLPLHASSRVNTAPDSPTAGRGARLGNYQDIEAKLQLSLRTKLAQNVLLPGADLWFGYTQQSLWQLYNRGESSPFRNTDYEPEAMVVVPVPSEHRLLPFGWHWRYGMAALAHQSNGQTVPLSRSWNRVYVGAGFERDDFTIAVRLNRRLHEDADSDDNPDLTAYRGRGDVTLNWSPGRATASLLWRTNFRDLDRGALQLDWTYPVEPDTSRALRWYVQLFSGYGENLLDYNFRQTSLGVGLSLFEF